MSCVSHLFINTLYFFQLLFLFLFFYSRSHPPLVLPPSSSFLAILNVLAPFQSSLPTAPPLLCHFPAPPLPNPSLPVHASSFPAPSTFPVEIEKKKRGTGKERGTSWWVDRQVERDRRTTREGWNKGTE